jgi:hypothetical protein
MASPLSCACMQANEAVHDQNILATAASSTSAAFCFVTWSICAIAWFTCSMPALCSWLAAVISPMMSVTRRMLSTTSFMVLPA